MGTIRIAWNTADEMHPTRFVLVEDVEVFGLEQPLSWPQGTELVYRGSPADGVVTVGDPKGRVASLPLRLLKKTTSGGRES